MEYTRSQLDNCVLLKARGRAIVIGEGDAQLIKEVRNLIEEGRRQVILNLAGVSKIDSSGVGALVSSYTNLMNVGGELMLSEVHPTIQEMLEMTAISKFLKSFDGDEAAAAAFGGA